MLSPLGTGVMEAWLQVSLEGVFVAGGRKGYAGRGDRVLRLVKTPSSDGITLRGQEWPPKTYSPSGDRSTRRRQEHPPATKLRDAVEEVPN